MVLPTDILGVHFFGKRVTRFLSHPRSQRCLLAARSSPCPPFQHHFVIVFLPVFMAYLLLFVWTDIRPQRHLAIIFSLPFLAYLFLLLIFVVSTDVTHLRIISCALEYFQCTFTSNSIISNSVYYSESVKNMLIVENIITKRDSTRLLTTCKYRWCLSPLIARICSVRSIFFSAF